MIDPNHPKIEDQLEIDLRAPVRVAKTNAERQREYREKMKALGRFNRTFSVTEDEAFYLQRLLLTLRDNPGSEPAMIRNAKGQLKPVDL